MSYRNASPSSKLADRSWRIRHSAWLLAVMLGVGFLSFVGFLYCAIRVRTRKWWTRAAVAGALSALGWVLMSLFVESNDGASASTASNNTASPMGDLAAGFVIAVWIGMTIYAVVVNREYLRWRAEPNAAWYNQPSGAASAAQGSYAQQMQPYAPAAPTPLLGVDPSAYYAPPQPPTSTPVPAAPSAAAASVSLPVDLNVADALTIASAVGLGGPTAARIVAVRDQRRGFQGIDDMVATTGLQPHELIKLRGKVTFGSYASTTPPGQAPPKPDQPTAASEPRSGRILDY